MVEVTSNEACCAIRRSYTAAVTTSPAQWSHSCKVLLRRSVMEHRDLTLKAPTLFIIAVTRGMLGAGIGLLLAGKLSESKRQIVGGALLTVGIASTIPLAMKVFQRRPAPGPQLELDLEHEPVF